MLFEATRCPELDQFFTAASVCRPPNGAHGWHVGVPNGMARSRSGFRRVRHTRKPCQWALSHLRVVWRDVQPSACGEDVKRQDDFVVIIIHVCVCFAVAGAFSPDFLGPLQQLLRLQPTLEAAGDDVRGGCVIRGIALAVTAELVKAPPARI